MLLAGPGNRATGLGWPKLAKYYEANVIVEEALCSKRDRGFLKRIVRRKKAPLKGKTLSAGASDKTFTCLQVLSETVQISQHGSNDVSWNQRQSFHMLADVA